LIASEGTEQLQERIAEYFRRAEASGSAGRCGGRFGVCSPSGRFVRFFLETGVAYEDYDLSSSFVRSVFE
jgi:hypothetical protein